MCGHMAVILLMAERDAESQSMNSCPERSDSCITGAMYTLPGSTAEKGDIFKSELQDFFHPQKE